MRKDRIWALDRLSQRLSWGLPGMAICPFRCPKMSVNDGIDSHISRTSYRSSLWCALAVRLAVASRQGGPGQRRRVPSTSVSLFSARHLARITFDGPSSYQLQAPSYRSPHVPLFSQDFTYATDTCPFSALEDPPAGQGRCLPPPKRRRPTGSPRWHQCLHVAKCRDSQF